MSTPTIFISAASDDLKEWRDVIYHAFERAGCKVYAQGKSFGASTRDVPRLLLEHLDKSDFVIHLAGMAYGSEPEHPPFPDYPHFKCSYTQFEYYYAHKQQKNVIAFVCATDFPCLTFVEKGRDAADCERRRKLQVEHRERVTKGRFTGTPLDGHSYRPLNETIPDVRSLLIAVAAAVGTIRDAAHGLPAAAVLAAVQEDLTKRAQELCPVDISRIDRYAPADLIGRESETALLTDAWAKVRRMESPRPHVITFVALGGEGKTSLVAKWAATLANKNWPACDGAFAWSFYSQGTKEQSVASSDLFLKEALLFFGDVEMANSPRMAVDKGKRLAELVGGRRALLILDGLEPLQYPPTSPLKGELRDHGITALLKGLAANSKGLCVVTTRYSVPDLKNFWQTTAREIPLLRLSKEAGVALLKSLGVKNGSQKDFETLVEEVKGHALTLNLIGTYLHDAHGGDIRKRDLVKFEEADNEEQHGHAFRVMDSYLKWFESEGEKGQRAIGVLRLLGLFDRPASADCLAALKQPPVIPGLTEALVGMTEAQRNIVFSRLEDAKLLTVNRDPSGTLLSLDAHPLIREYFASRMQRQHPNTWRAAHQRLFEHLCETTKEGDRPTLEILQPLYQAVAHGCQAGMQREAISNVFYSRVRRREEAYSLSRLGAFGSDLGAIACLFETPWSHVSAALPEANQAFCLNEAAFCLGALGRLTEALEPMRAGVESYLNQMRLDFAAINSGNLSELELTLGGVVRAMEDAGKSVMYADRSGDALLPIGRRVALADAQHQNGLLQKAYSGFAEAENLFKAEVGKLDFLVGMWGFRYCNLLLGRPERAAWREMQGLDIRNQKSEFLGQCRTVSQRTAQTLKWALQSNSGFLDAALDHLTLGRAALFVAIMEKSGSQNAQSEIENAVDGLRRAGDSTYVPHGLLTRACLRFLIDARTGQERAHADLDEAWEIAERGSMRLFMADIHLYRARLFHGVKPYPWAVHEGKAWGPKEDLAAARALIVKCGYWRRKEELEDAEKAALNW